ncbi:hypothetical protein IQ07DRAFT_635503 [Pyrenochaeta sp. DS3sAY3a]|nr:hypothetical protein IQ07DRAFT_635503 [Pyrenochaeta sp. DS3sAY3a]
MRLTSIAFVSSAVVAVMAAPAGPVLATRTWTPSSSDGNIIPRDVKDQGDGFYLAHFNGTELEYVEFTPLSEFEPRAAVPHVTAREPTSSGLKKRSTTCSGRRTNNLGDLTRANVALANNGNGKWYNQHAWGWVHIGQDTSFFCNYQGNWLTYNLIIEMHTVVSSVCGENGYGYDRRTNSPQGPRDLSVGRTWRGDEFCAPGFKG